MCCRYYMELSPEIRIYTEEVKKSKLAAKMIDRLGKPLVTEGEIPEPKSGWAKIKEDIRARQLKVVKTERR